MQACSPVLGGSSWPWCMVPWLFGGLWSLGGPWFGGGFLVVSWWSLGAVLAASSWSSWCSATIWGPAPAQVVFFLPARGGALTGITSATLGRSSWPPAQRLRGSGSAATKALKPRHHPAWQHKAAPSQLWRPGARFGCSFSQHSLAAERSALGSRSGLEHIGKCGSRRCDCSNVTASAESLTLALLSNGRQSPQLNTTLRLRSLTATGLNVTSLHCVHCSLEALQKYARRLAFLRLCTVKVIDLRGCCLQRVTSLKAQHTYVDSTLIP